MTLPLRAILFDAYGTLLDVHSVATLAEDIVPGRGAALSARWREKQLQYTWLRTLSGRYADFWQVTAEALDYALADLGIAIDAGRRDALMGQYLKLSPFAEADAALRRLSALRLPLAVLSNGTPSMLEAAFAAAGLRGRFDALISIDAARRYKTAPEAYRLAIERYGGSAGEFLLVSSNGWDVAGAGHFGFRTFWVNRHGAPVEKLGIAPTAIGASLDDLVLWLAPQTPT